MTAALLNGFDRDVLVFGGIFALICWGCSRADRKNKRGGWFDNDN